MTPRSGAIRLKAGRQSQALAPAVVLGLSLRLLQPSRAVAEDHVDAKFENYQEEHNRIHVDTVGALFDKILNDTLSIKGEFVYDSISGATPTGAPPPPGSDQVPLTHMEETRYAGNAEAAIHFGLNTLTPQVSYSSESDYTSLGLALNYQLDLNEKNTTLNVGFAQDFDTIYPANSPYLTQNQYKSTSQGILGVTQLLGPETVLSVAFTLGYASGYLDDPYRGVQFDGYPWGLFPEQRPDTRFEQVGYVSITQFVKPVNASVEASYRIYHDSWTIWSQTAGLAWFQNIGKYVVLNPFGRFYTQTAAYFYGVSFPGDPTLSPVGIPPFYSADYRLSELRTWTYGLKALVRILGHVSVDAQYFRYEMHGTDGVTSQSAYPTANVVSAGASVWF
ncbi:MAG TPA: DUF3570 domain-containing protein [Candidatus Nitrosotalea sp.]|nr:DUF3570 domain-containing protein [Candidatus Nitrosotalea sp.]